MSPLSVYQIVVSIFVLFALVNAIADWFTFRQPDSSSPSPGYPLAGVGRGGRGVRAGWGVRAITILIPARDEAAVIRDCVESLLSQEYPGRLEILVLDDR